MSAGVARPFAELFGGLPGDGDIASLARAAARAKYAVLPIAPGTKRPLCTLTPRQVKAADKQAAEAAKSAGKRNWERKRHECGDKHATTDPVVAHRVFKRLEEEHPHLNIAAELWASRAFVVDADTAAELASFTAFWAEQEHEVALRQAAPTVRSPGEVGEDGQWKHSEGGHFWFLLPEDVELDPAGKVTSIPIGSDPENQAQLKVSGYALLPPSVRPEGEYRMASDAHVAPEWMIELVQLYITERRVTREYRRDRALDADDTINLAQSTIVWATALEPRGWTLWHKVDRCGCEIWTAPGDHASRKSGTFHDAGCAEFDTVDGFCHIWTDNPPSGLRDSGLKTFSKTQFVAWHDHGGDMSAAMRELGILRERSEPTVLTRRDFAGNDQGSKDSERPGPTRSQAQGPGQDRVTDEDSDSDETPSDQAESDEEAEDRTSWTFRDLRAVLAGENPEPEPCVLARVDGQHLFYPGKVNGVIGPSESGKSWIVCAAVARELKAGRPVLYLDFEDTASGIVSRLRSLGVTDEMLDPDAGLFAYADPEEALHVKAYDDYRDMLRDRDWSMIVFDGVNAAMTQDGLDLLSNTDATKFFTKVTRPASLTGAAVVTVDHVPKDQEKRGKGGIGAQAKRATITGSSIFVEVIEPFGRGKSGSVRLIVDKDRPGYVRGASNASDVWAEVKIIAGNDGSSVEIELTVPEAVNKIGVSEEQQQEYRYRVSEYLAQLKGAAVSATNVVQNVDGKNDYIRAALNWLSNNDHVDRQPASRGFTHRLIKPYRRPGPTTLHVVPDPEPAPDDEPFGGGR